jgi:hypothetical protein
MTKAVAVWESDTVTVTTLDRKRRQRSHHESCTDARSVHGNGSFRRHTTAGPKLVTFQAGLRSIARELHQNCCIQAPAQCMRFGACYGKIWKQ